jgi:anti-sigma-K factor RskA
MSAPSDHRRWRAELSAYLLGSLEADEVAALERHLESCRHCRDELRWLQPAIDMIPESVPQLEPPAELRERLMAEVRGDAGAAASAEADGALERPAAPSRLSDRLRGFLLRPVVALTAIALIAAVAAGYAVRGGGGEATTTIGARGGNAVRAKLERHGDSGTLELTGLSQLPPSRVYQAWVHRNHRNEPYGLFEARHDGSASAVIPHHLNGADSVMVTREPRGGSKQPSSPPIVTVPLRG